MFASAGPDHLQIIIILQKKVLDFRYSSIISSIIDLTSPSQVSKNKCSSIDTSLALFEHNIFVSNFE